MTDEEVCELVITAPESDWLIEFTRRLVSDHLAASVHHLPEIRSIYMWQGEVYDRPEARAAVHTRTALVPWIVERLDAEHPYEVPGVFALPIVATSPAYRAWMLAQTVRPPGDDLIGGTSVPTCLARARHIGQSVLPDVIERVVVAVDATPSVVRQH